MYWYPLLPHQAWKAITETQKRKYEVTMNCLHFILVAVLDTAMAGGLHQERAEAIFYDLSPFFSEVPVEDISTFEDNVRRILDVS
jgi:hypothetical protein